MEVNIVIWDAFLIMVAGIVSAFLSYVLVPLWNKKNAKWAIIVVLMTFLYVLVLFLVVFIVLSNYGFF